MSSETGVLLANPQFCSSCGARFHPEAPTGQIVDSQIRGKPAEASNSLATAKIFGSAFRSDVGLSVIAYTGLGGWIASLLPFVDISTGLITGAAIGLFRKI